MIHLRPSASNIWTRCAASSRLRKNTPESGENDAAREGTAAAWVAELGINGQVIACSDLIGESHENGWLITKEMTGYIQDYVDLIRSRPGKVEAEKRGRLTEFISGTMDACTFGQDSKIYVDDLKYGFGIVEPKNNTQLAIYAASVLPEMPHVKSVQLGIYQPRAQHHEGIYRTWEISVNDLQNFAMWIIQKGMEAQSPNSIATPGSHCRYCDASLNCEALAHTTYAAFSVIESASSFNIEPKAIGPELEKLHDFTALIKARISALEAEAESLLRSGKFIPGWHLNDRIGKNRIKQKHTPEAVKAITGVDPFKKVLRSPNELIIAGASKKAVGILSERPRIGSKLEKVSEKYFDDQFNPKKEKP